MDFNGNILADNFTNITTETITVVNNIDGEPLNTHIADTTKHFLINDAVGDSTTEVYSVNRSNIHENSTTKHWQTGLSNNSIHYGGNTLASNTGFNNIVIGNDSGVSIVNAQNNTLVGNNCGENLLTSTNTAIGGEALTQACGSGNTAVGYKSGYSVTGARNTSIGVYESGFPQITSGFDNVAVGCNAGENSLASDSCCFIGKGAGSNGTTVTNSIALGNDAIVNLSNVCNIGNSSLVAITTGSANCSLGSVGNPFLNIYGTNATIPNIAYDNTISGLTATTVKLAIDEVAAGGTILASNITMDKLTNAGYSTVQHMQDTFHSSGIISGGGITNNGDGSIAVGAGEGYIRATASPVVPLLFASWLANPIVTLTNLTLNYITATYAGTDYLTISSQLTESVGLNSFTIATVFRDGTTLHISLSAKHDVGDHANKMINRSRDTQYIARAQNGGALISETGTRQIIITQGTWWSGLTRYTTASFNSSAGNTFRYYYNRSTYVEVPTQTQIDNLQYDNAGVLTALGNNQYGCHYVYIGADNDVYVIYGIGTYSLADANNASVPTVFPLHFQKHATLIGKIIVQKSAGSFTSIQSAFTTTFTGSIQANVVNGIGVDEAIVRFDTNGNILQNSGVLIDDSNNMTGVTSITSKAYKCATSVGGASGINNYVMNNTPITTMTSGAIQNILIGTETGGIITGGNKNVLIGHRVGKSITTTNENVVIGNDSGMLLTGSFNTIVGAGNSSAFTAGARNVIVGHGSATTLLDATACTILGSSAQVSPSNTNQIAIGYQATTSVANECVIGNSGLLHIRSLANCDLGTIGSKFKDLYLSGNVFYTDRAHGVFHSTTNATTTGSTSYAPITVATVLEVDRNNFTITNPGYVMTYTGTPTKKFKIECMVVANAVTTSVNNFFFGISVNSTTIPITHSYTKVYTQSTTSFTANIIAYVSLVTSDALRLLVSSSGSVNLLCEKFATIITEL